MDRAPQQMDALSTRLGEQPKVTNSQEKAASEIKKEKRPRFIKRV